MGAGADPALRGYRDLLERALDGPADQVLLSDARSRLSRSDLDHATSSVHQRLRELGCGPECLVAIRLDPGTELITAILGALRTGAAYLSLDPRHGPQRLEQIIENVRPEFLITTTGVERLQGDLPTGSGDLDDLGYVITTSGSTGTPKTAMLEQRGLVIHTNAMIDLLGLGPDDVVLQTAPPSFDIAVWQSTTPVIAGSRTHVATDDQRLDPRELWRLITAERATVVQLVPSMIRVMLDNPVPRDELALRHVISTGEALDPVLANRWLAVYPDLPLINLYGPAECSDDVSVHVVHRPVDPSQPVPIGRAFAGAILSVVDEEGAPVDDGTVGELRVSGDIVGRGYRHDPETTAAVFSKSTAGVRTYATGDLVFVDEAGLLRYVGRKDFQVKVRGNRVELGEIEAVVADDDRVRACVVVKFDDNTDRLVAHVETEADLDRSELRRRVAERLPAYMVPSAVVLHGRLPLNANGKIDRGRLPAPARDDIVVASAEGRTPQTDLERRIAANWAKLLDLDTVPVDADFYDLGGTSLLAVISIDDLGRELGFEIPTRTLVTEGSVERIARALEVDRSAQGDGEDRRATGIVQLQEGTGTPLFLYPGEAGTALGMVDLGRRVARGRPIYVFEPARPSAEEPAPPMALLARRCRDAMATVQPADEPAHLGGFCMGGDVAWEIAHQRQDKGEPTASVLLLQTERDGVYPSWPASMGRPRIIAAKIWQRARFEWSTVRALGPAQRRSHLKHLLVGKAIAKLTLPIEARLHRLGLGRLPGVRKSLRLRQLEWALVDRQAYDGWIPGRLSCEVSVLSATEQPPLVNADPTLGWSSTGSPNLSPRSIPAFHWTFLHHPQVIELAEVVSAELDRNDPQASR
ncbi:MAG: amino acid adenylation domain-containing protein [Actinomycetota bacterium]